jgi:hypothetical protein
MRCTLPSTRAFDRSTSGSTLSLLHDERIGLIGPTVELRAARKTGTICSAWGSIAR